MVEKVLQLNKERTVFWALLGVLVLSAGFYMFCIKSTIHNVVARQNIENEISQLTLSIGKEEFAYINKRNAVTIATAYAMGFQDIKDKQFISQKTDTKVAFLSR